MSSHIAYEYSVSHSRTLARIAKAYLQVLPPEVKTLCVSGSSGVAIAAAMMAKSKRNLMLCYVPKPGERRHGYFHTPEPPVAFVDDFIASGETLKRVRTACRSVEIAYAITDTDKKIKLKAILGKTEHIWPLEGAL